LWSAANGEDALAYFEKGEIEFDIVISDVVMPGQDGPSWVRAAQKYQADFKTIFVSGYAKEEFSEELARLPNIAFLPKPYSLRALVDMVSKVAQS